VLEIAQRRNNQRIHVRRIQLILKAIVRDVEGSSRSISTALSLSQLGQCLMRMLLPIGVDCLLRHLMPLPLRFVAVCIALLILSQALSSRSRDILCVGVCFFELLRGSLTELRLLFLAGPCTGSRAH
jgi:hypothetical protein